VSATRELLSIIVPVCNEVGRVRAVVARLLAIDLLMSRALPMDYVR